MIPCKVLLFRALLEVFLFSFFTLLFAVLPDGHALLVPYGLAPYLTLDVVVLSCGVQLQGALDAFRLTQIKWVILL